MADFSPHTSYSCSLVASNTQGSGPPAPTSFTTLQDCERLLQITTFSVCVCVDFTVDSYFQIRLGGVVACAELIVSINSNNYHYFTQMMLQVSSTDRKLSDITTAVVNQLQTSCGECAPEMIDSHFFVCYPESTLHVTYRARLEGTSERGSDSLISLIEDWVSGGPGVIVTGVLMTVDPHCSVAISFLSERECLPPPANTTDPAITDPPITDPPITNPPITDPPTTDSPNATTEDPNTEEPPVTDPITDPTATVVGGIDTPDTGATSGPTTGIIAGGVVGIVVIVLIIAITIAIVVIVFLVLKSRRGEFAVKKSDRKYVHYCIYTVSSSL